jgi:hypothetical protein
MKTIQIPIDERTGKPLVTSAMKTACLSEFTFPMHRVCHECFEEADENCDVCGGEIDYVDQITVPWDTCKEIYKAMSLEAAKDLK